MIENLMETGWIRPDVRSGVEQTEDVGKMALEFESLFLAQLLKIMHESIESSGLFSGSPGGDTYMSLVHQELAASLAEKGGLGLARMIEDNLSDPGTRRSAEKDPKGNNGSESRR